MNFEDQAITKPAPDVNKTTWTREEQIPKFDYCVHGIERRDCEQCSRAFAAPVPTADGARQWPRVFNVKRTENNTWHADISFAHCPTDAELRALEISLCDDHQTAPTVSPSPAVAAEPTLTGLQEDQILMGFHQPELCKTVTTPPVRGDREAILSKYFTKEIAVSIIQEWQGDALYKIIKKYSEDATLDYIWQEVNK